MRSSPASLMASCPGVIFPESMKDFLTNLIQLCFKSMPVDSDSTASSTGSAPVANSASVGSTSMEQDLHLRIITPLAQQVDDLSLSKRIPNILAVTRPPTPSDLIAGLDRISNTIAECIDFSEAALRPTRSAQGPSLTPFGLRNSVAAFSAKIAQSLQIQSGDQPAPIQFPDRGEFQVPRIVLTPNSYGSNEESNSSTLDREAFMVFADNPPRDGETSSQEAGRNTKNQECAVQRQREQADTQQHQQPAANTEVGVAGDQRRPPAIANSDPPRTNDGDNADQDDAPGRRRRPPRARNLQADLEEAGHNIFTVPKTNLGAAFTDLKNLPDSEPLRRIRACIRVANAQIEEGPHSWSAYSWSTATQHSRSRSSHHRGDHGNRVEGRLEPIHEEEVEQPANPPANNDTHRRGRRGDDKDRGR